MFRLQFIYSFKEIALNDKSENRNLKNTFKKKIKNHATYGRHLVVLRTHYTLELKVHSSSCAFTPSSAYKSPLQSSGVKVLK